MDMRAPSRDFCTSLTSCLLSPSRSGAGGGHLAKSCSLYRGCEDSAVLAVGSPPEQSRIPQPLYRVASRTLLVFWKDSAAWQARMPLLALAWHFASSFDSEVDIS